MIDYKRYQAELQKSFKDKYCLIPGCKNKKIIRAHTVQKNGGIAAIARDGIVYTFLGLGDSLRRILEANDRLSFGTTNDSRTNVWPNPDEMGVNKASTITAFCAEHDRVIFSPIELEDFIPTEKQIWLYAFRCVAYELNKKHASAKENVNVLMKDYITNNALKVYADFHTAGARIGEKEIFKVFNELYNGINNLSSLKLYYVLFSMDKKPEIVCSFSRFINLDFEPTHMHISEKSDYQWITCSCFEKNGFGYVLFSWNREHDKPMEFVRMILDNADPGNMIANLFFYCAENVFFSPDWWDSLPVAKKIAIEKEVIQIMPDLKSILSRLPRKIVDWNFKHSSNCGL